MAKAKHTTKARKAKPTPTPFKPSSTTDFPLDNIPKRTKGQTQSARWKTRKENEKGRLADMQKEIKHLRALLMHYLRPEGGP